MRAGAHARTVFAGFGVSGSLLAAVGAAFLVGGSVLAFESWPADAGPAPEATIDVARIAPVPAAQTAAIVDLPAAVTPPAANRAQAAAPTPPAAAPRSTDRGDVSPAEENRPDPASAPVGSDAPATPPPGIVPDLREADLPAAVAQTTDGLASTVAAAGAGIPAVKPVTDLVGATVAGTGETVAATLKLLSPAQ